MQEKQSSLYKAEDKRMKQLFEKTEALGMQQPCSN